MSIATKGYERLRELLIPGKDSHQCFVAMWSATEMKKVFEEAIKPAIEYTEDGETESRFTALPIFLKEHTSDIDDEILTEIRRSKFMICDLTGHRGGVYHEACYAFGLGLNVIYTCRKDWIKGSPLNDRKGIDIKYLYDKNKKSIRIKKEGIHFYFNHRPYIKWEGNKLEIFKYKLINYIKINII